MDFAKAMFAVGFAGYFFKEFPTILRVGCARGLTMEMFVALILALLVAGLIVYRSTHLPLHHARRSH